MLSALAHDTRLSVFRFLVRSGPGGASAGSVATQLQIAPASLSFHLKALVASGLVEVRRKGRLMIYRVATPGMVSLLDFLTFDCCEGQPELCGLSIARREEV